MVETFLKTVKEIINKIEDLVPTENSKNSKEYTKWFVNAINDYETQKRDPFAKLPYGSTEAAQGLYLSILEFAAFYKKYAPETPDFQNPCGGC